MDLRAIREKFVTLTGRLDLADDKTADMFINAGIRTLDRKANVKHTQQTMHYVFVRTDQDRVPIPECWRIDRLTVRDEKGQNFHNHLQLIVPPGSVARPFWQAQWAAKGRPTHYAMLTTRNDAQLEKLSLDKILVPANYMHTADHTGHHMTVQLFPKADADYVLEVWGKFWSPKLIEETDTNLWSQLYPDLLIKAACHSLEVFYRNTEGANDWMVAIMDELRDLEQMEIVAYVEDISVMEG